jgi:hypothetical protein
MELMAEKAAICEKIIEKNGNCFSLEIDIDIDGLCFSSGASCPLQNICYPTDLDSDTLKKAKKWLEVNSASAEQNGNNKKAHTVSIEKLYHFKCCECNTRWSISERMITSAITCPYCQETRKVALPDLTYTNGEE